MVTNSNQEEPTRKLCLYFVYKNCTRSIQLMYIKCIQNVYKIKKTTPPKFCIQNVYKSLSKCGIHFVYKHFVQILYTKVCRNMNIFCIQTFCIYFVYVLYTKCIQKFVEMWDTSCIQTFCIHFVYINSDLLKADIINIMYTKMYIQVIVCRMDLLFQHIFTHLLCTS